VRFDDPVAEENLPHFVLVAQNAADARQEILTVVMGVEACEVGPEDPIQECGAPAVRQQAKDLVGGERNVQREANPDARELLLEQRRQKEELVVMYPYQVAGLGHLRDRVTEGSVDALVASPKALVVVDLGKEVMEQRPEGVVAESLVVRFGFRPRQKHRACRE